MSEYVLERLNVNDDDHKLISVLVEDGTHVNAGTVVAELETSKAAVELEAAFDGEIYFLAKPGQILKVGDLVYRIGEPPENQSADEQAQSDFSHSTPDIAETASASESISDKPSDAGAHRGYRVSRSYMAPRPSRRFSHDFSMIMNLTDGGLPRTLSSAKPETYIGENTRKKAEVENLSVVNPSGLVSCLFAKCSGTRRRVAQEGLFKTNFADLIIYETARLISKYPLLNAFYDNESGLQVRDAVRIGYSIDVEDDLTVYNLGDCDKMGIPEIRDSLENAMEAHLTRKLTRTHMEPSTLTLSDLSGSGIRHFVPLINGQQSAIIGYSSDSDGAPLISLAFDHRAMGGLYVARFLEDLVTRLDSHLLKVSADLIVECAFCGKDAETLRKLRERGLMRIVTPDGEDVLCCETCFTHT